MGGERAANRDHLGSRRADESVWGLTRLQRTLNSRAKTSSSRASPRVGPRIPRVTWISTLRVRRFAAVGVINTLVDYTVFIMLTKLLHLPLDAVWIAKLASGSLAISISFYLNRTWVFAVSGTPLAHAGRFVVTTLVAIYLIQTPLTQLFAGSHPAAGKAVYELLKETGLASPVPSITTEAFAVKTTAFVLATCVSMTFNFLMYRFWVFRTRRGT